MTNDPARMTVVDAMKALDSDPQDYNALHGLALAHRKTGNLQEARRALERILVISPYDGQSRFLIDTIDGKKPGFGPPPGLEWPAGFVIEYDFLSSDEHDVLLAYAQRQEHMFAAPTVFQEGKSTVDTTVRDAKVIMSPERSAVAPVVDRVERRIAELADRLIVAPFEPGAIEPQLTAHNDGDFYGVHRDSDPHFDTAVTSRVLTFVYYFHGQPKGFTGGDLRLFDTARGLDYYNPDRFTQVSPTDNMIIFFHAPMMHEVLPVRCPSRRFIDSRFTINGWIHGERRADPVLPTFNPQSV